MVQGLLAGLVGAALAITVLTLRPGETTFLILVSLALFVAAAIPALWIILQILPLHLLAHPIWRSAETALQHTIAGGISVDPGARALAPIYREMGDPPSGSVASTAAGTLAIELGLPMLWLITAAAVGGIVVLLRASLQRGRDSFYPAMAGAASITLLLLAFANAGLLGNATGLIAAAVVGLGFAQSKSRTRQA